MQRRARRARRHPRPAADPQREDARPGRPVHARGDPDRDRDGRGHRGVRGLAADRGRPRPVRAGEDHQRPAGAALRRLRHRPATSCSTRSPTTCRTSSSTAHFYKLVGDFDKRFPEGAPSMKKARRRCGSRATGPSATASRWSATSTSRRAPRSGSPPTPSSTGRMADGWAITSVDEHLARILDGHRAAAGVPAAADGGARPRRGRGRRRRGRPAVLRQLRDGRVRRTPRGRRRPRPPSRRCTCRWSARSAPARRGLLALAPGTAAKIMTGAPMPAGADSVVPYEWTDRGVAQVRIDQAPQPRPARPARRARTSPSVTCWSRDGTVLGPRHIGLLAAVGRATRAVAPATAGRGDLDRLRAARARAPRSATTRSTTATPSCSPRPRGAAGAIAYRVGIVPDEPRAFLDALHDQLVRADIVVTSGGVSQGDFDVVKEALAPLGHGVVRPGRDAAGQAAGLRARRRGPDADLHAAGQPGLVVRLLRAVRAARRSAS